MTEIRKKINKINQKSQKIETNNNKNLPQIGYKVDKNQLQIQEIDLKYEKDVQNHQKLNKKLTKIHKTLRKLTKNR